MLRDLAVFRSATPRNEAAIFEASLNCEIEPGAISGGLTTTHDLFGAREAPASVPRALAQPAPHTLPDHHPL